MSAPPPCTFVLTKSTHRQTDRQTDKHLPKYLKHFAFVQKASPGSHNLHKKIYIKMNESTYLLVVNRLIKHSFRNSFGLKCSLKAV